VASAVIAALAGFLLMQAAFRNWRLALVGFMLLAVALTGGVVAVLIGGAELSLGSMIGFLALLALAARASVLSVRRFQDLEWSEGETFGQALVLRGGQDRLAPILTTASAVALSVLPFVVLGSRPGLELVHPMAVVILGGLLTTTFVGLFVVPALYLRFGVAAAAPTPEWDGVVTRPWGGTPELAPRPVAATVAASGHEGGSSAANGSGNGGPATDTLEAPPPGLRPGQAEGEQ
jgi:Cu/Ag efflux pump CusA